MSTSLQERSIQVKAFREQGQKVVGYFCCAPVEIITAAGLIPYRITGDMRNPEKKAYAHLEPILCPFARSTFDVALQGGYDFLDGLLIPNTCDNLDRIYPVWTHHFKPEVSNLLLLPHTTSAPSQEFLKAEFKTFIGKLETYIGRKITEEQIKESIKIHNRNRKLIRELLDLRKVNPPVLSGIEMMDIVLENLSLPVADANERLENVLAEMKARPAGQPSDLPRLMIWGSEMDDPIFIEMVEKSGSHVVIDDLCMGTRPFWNLVPDTVDPLDGLSEHYLKGTNCPRVYNERTGTRQDELNDRFGHITAMAKEWNAEGVILFLVKYCDNHSFEVPDLKDYLNAAGLNVMVVETDYKMANLGQYQLRIQAFLEMMQ